MASKKRGSRPNVMKKKDDGPIIIKADIKVATGHQTLDFRTGKHQDRRFKRRRTRGASVRQAIASY